MKVEKGLTVKKLVEILQGFPQDLEVEMEFEEVEKLPFIFRKITHIEEGIKSKEDLRKVFLTSKIDWD